MANGQRHIDNNGNIGVCRASDASKCPYDGNGGHFDTREEAEAAYGALQENGGIPESFRRARNPKSDGFSLEKGGYYGKTPPRTIQIDALNDTTQALIEDGNTQLVAACGTGKSFMGRQLMRRMMEEEGANGVAIVLTSSRKLAIDTASDLRPGGNSNYDEAMGIHGEDYEVEIIEIHSDSKDGIKENGAVSPERIAKRWKAALDAGKKVVIVSTYQSSDKVQQVQALIGERAEADLLMNDEAHNILGQKRSVSSSDEAENSGYRSFANEIPGAIQAKHRLYATATPALADSPDDQPSHAQGATREAQVAALSKQAEEMRLNGKARLTVYSDDIHIVGRVSGAITQEQAIEESYLTTPRYQIRDAVVSASSADSFVDANGREISYTKPPKATRETNLREPLSAQSYAGVSAMLNALTEDPKVDVDAQGRSIVRNPSHNALAYTGSIAQANAFKRDFRAVALAHSGNMEIKDAERFKNSSDPELRRRARIRLLAENVEIKAAHSESNRETTNSAFSMFRGKGFKSEESGWSPHKRILANVDIFSEGVSINEIDTAVNLDGTKLGERALTQLVGRTLRVDGDSPEKNTGYIITPRVINAQGKELNGGLVTAAAYGATRVERAVSTRKLKGLSVEADTTTQVALYGSSGELRGNQLAASIASTHVKSSEDLVASQVMERAHAALLSKSRSENSGYAAMDTREKLQMQRDHIMQQAASTKNSDPSWAVANKVLSKVSVTDMPTIRQSGRVVTAALSAGDFASVDPKMIDSLTRAGIIRRKATARGAKVEAPERRKFLEESAPTLALALSSNAVDSMDKAVYARITHGVDPVKARVYVNSGKGDRENYERLMANYHSAVAESPEFRDRVLKIIESTDGDTKRKSPEESLSNTLGGLTRRSGINYGAEARRVRSLEQTAVAESAASGSADYEIDPAMVSKNGVLKAPAQRKLSELI